MAPRIAIPVPHSSDAAYAARALPQYERAIELAGGIAVPIPFDLPPADVQRIAEMCDGVLLPGSNADVDPTKFHAERSERTAAADPRRDEVDNLLLRSAYDRGTPVLGICYGLQSLNVYRAGSLIQHIPDFLPQEMRGRVNHEAGKMVPVAHTVEIEAESKLSEIVTADSGGLKRSNGSVVLGVNSSHHQSAETIGDGLRVVARCAEDGIIEAIEGTAPDHFVVAVQWHPERAVEDDAASRAIFVAFVEAAHEHGRKIAGSE